MEEIWKDVVGYEGFYAVSNLGKIKRLVGAKCKTERLIKPYLYNGTPMVDLCANSVYKRLRVSLIVAQAFIGTIPENSKIAHIDGDKTNNVLSNITYAPNVDTFKYKEQEIWKDIEGFNGRYQVSNFGRVRSNDMTVVRKDGITYQQKGKILSQADNGNGYQHIGLSMGGKQKYFGVHILVAKAFVPNPYNKPEVGHKDETRDNNHADNLEWVTSKENCNMPKRMERLKAAREKGVKK